MAAKIDFTNDGYDSDLEEPEPKKTWRSDPLAKKESSKPGLPNKKVFRDEVDAAARRIGRHNGFMAMDAYSRHKQMINFYCLNYSGKEHFVRDSSRDKNDYDVLTENHRFLWDDEDDDAVPGKDSWGKQLAKRYYDKLFKEYCIADLSLYKDNKVAMRWRVEKEVLDGKGQFVCGEKRCASATQLTSWEVNFGYMERGAKKNALVKLRLCEGCSDKLNYHHKHRKAKQEKELRRARKRGRQEERRARKKRKHERSAESSGVSSSDSESQEVADARGDAADRAQALLSSLSGNVAVATTTGSQAVDASGGADQVWKKAVQVDVAKTREEEFDEYFEDMFL